MLKFNPTRCLSSSRTANIFDSGLRKSYIQPSSKVITRSLPSRAISTSTRVNVTSFTTKTFNSNLPHHQILRSYATGGKIVKVPGMGDSISEGTIQAWKKQVGEGVQTDDVVASIETDKVAVEIRAPESGVLTEQFAKEGDTVKVGADLFRYEPGAAGTKTEAPKAAAPQPTQQQQQTPAAEKPQQKAPEKPAAPKPTPTPAPAAPVAPAGARTENRVRMTRLRSTVAERLKDAQNTYAMLTTFNEIDMSNINALRSQYKEEFEKKHGVKLGFMSAFIKASVAALRENPNVNAVIDGNEIVYRNYVDVSVAVATPRGLFVPVIRDVDRMSFADIEKSLAELSKKAKENQIAIEDMAGGTFTISNGGVYGSLMGTPIINPPQSAILGMHAVKDRAVVVGGQVVSRPMMYVALTYDHRLLDGKDAVTFLKKIKDVVEDPRRLLLDL